MRKVALADIDVAWQVAAMPGTRRVAQVLRPMPATLLSSTRLCTPFALTGYRFISWLSTCLTKEFVRRDQRSHNFNADWTGGSPKRRGRAHGRLTDIRKSAAEWANPGP